MKSRKTPSMDLKWSKNVLQYAFGPGTRGLLHETLAGRRRSSGDYAVFFVDHYFRGKALPKRLPRARGDALIFVDSSHEPTTDDMDDHVRMLSARRRRPPCAIVGIGGGCTLDTAKAVSNLLTNGGRAREYQGWDLVRVPGIFKIGIPTLSGTGAESSRTCVMINPANGLKLGMNSEHTLFDRLILDSDLSSTVPRQQFFYTGMDAYLHCIESLRGAYRHPVGDAFSREALRLCREVFMARDMKTPGCRAKLMIASYLGGCAIANSFVGVIHPVSAGLSVVLGIHHGLGNCLAIAALREFYPADHREFLEMTRRQRVRLPRGICRGLTDGQFDSLYRATIVHERPLANALGKNFRKILTPRKVRAIFERI